MLAKLFILKRKREKEKQKKKKYRKKCLRRPFPCLIILFFLIFEIFSRTSTSRWRKKEIYLNWFFLVGFKILFIYSRGQ